MSAARKIWTPYEEKKLLQMWRRNLKALHSAKNRFDVYTDFSDKFKLEGINISPTNIRAKMGTFRRRYLCLREDKCQQKKWTYFKTLSAIIEYGPGPNTEGTQTEHNETRNSQVDEVSTTQPSEKDCPKNQATNQKVLPSPVSSIKKSHPRKVKRKTTKKHNTNPHQKPRRRVWALEEEEIFVELWQKYFQSLRAEKKNSGVYKEMQSELHGQGIEITVAEIRAKISSLIRRFRSHHESDNPDKEWVHYTTVSELLLPLATSEVPDNSENSRQADETDSWLNGIVSPVICMQTEDNMHIKKPKIDVDDADSDTIIFFEPLNNDPPSNPQHDPILNDADDCAVVHVSTDLETDGIKDISVTETAIGQTSTPATANKQLTIEFGQFVTKELDMLSDDLLIEAKRQIYNIICAMQIRQLQTNK